MVKNLIMDHFSEIKKCRISDIKKKLAYSFS